MIKSMTGFGRSEYKDGKRNINVEIRTVNHRYCDVNLKLPRRYGFAEEKLVALVKQQVNRGKVDIYIGIESLSEEEMRVQSNLPLAQSYYKHLLELKEYLGLQEELGLSYLISMPDVIKVVPNIEDEKQVLESLSIAVSQALCNLNEMREREGANIKEDLMGRGQQIGMLCDDIEGREDELLKAYKERLEDRIGQLLDSSVDLPEERIAVEAAIFADKSNITEELVRLKSHISQLEFYLNESQESPGKKMDFLVQEMNREANTIGSKANDIGITKQVLEMKSEIEKIREQVQNIE